MLFFHFGISIMLYTRVIGEKFVRFRKKTPPYPQKHPAMQLLSLFARSAARYNGADQFIRKGASSHEKEIVIPCTGTWTADRDSVRLRQSVHCGVQRCTGRSIRSSHPRGTGGNTGCSRCGDGSLSQRPGGSSSCTRAPVPFPRQRYRQAGLQQRILSAHQRGRFDPDLDAYAAEPYGSPG